MKATPEPSPVRLGVEEKPFVGVDHFIDAVGKEKPAVIRRESRLALWNEFAIQVDNHRSLDSKVTSSLDVLAAFFFTPLTGAALAWKGDPA